MKMGNGPQSMSFSIGVTVKSTANDGTRNVGITVSMPHMPVLGTTWHWFAMESQADVIYTITGHEQAAGRDNLAIAMKNAPGAPVTLRGQGTYDRAFGR